MDGHGAPTEALPLELTIQAMDEGDVDIGLAAAWYGPAGDLISNDEVAAYRGGYPDRLRGVAGADLRRPMEAVRDLRRRVDEGSSRCGSCRGCGSCRRPTGSTTRSTRRASTSASRSAPRSATPARLRPSETGRPIPYIDQVAIDFPELVIVCGHIGYPWTAEMIAVADKHPNVYIDTSRLLGESVPGRAGRVHAGTRARRRCCSEPTTR